MSLKARKKNKKEYGKGYGWRDFSEPRFFRFEALVL
jgi:hypothetical protein